MNKIVRRKQTSIWNRATRTNLANDRPVLGRLMGVETEYAIKFDSETRKGQRGFDFGALMRMTSQQLPVAPSISNPYRYFLANGGSISLEHGGAPSVRSALLESATPECTSPRQLLCYQMANEQLLSSSIAQAHSERNVCLVKGDADSHGHFYGQHESYEVEIARSWRLVGWRIGLILLLPVLLVYRLVASLWFLCIWYASSLETIMTRAWRAMRERFDKSSAETASNKTLDPSDVDRVIADVEPSEDEESVLNARRTREERLSTRASTRWIVLCAWGLRWMHGPVVWALWLNMYLFALVPHRRYLSAFFASRCILDGAGYLDRDNRYWLSLRASMVNSLIGYGSYHSSRPIYRCDCWLRSLFAGPPWSLEMFWRLFRRRQRIEIAIGDSGLCQQSQFVRFGSTSLVFDLVERGLFAEMPELKNPVAAIHRYARDWMMLCTVPGRANRIWSAIEIQHAYAANVRAMLQRSANVPIEAWKILDCWQTTLNQMDRTDASGELPRSMLGRIDWISKLWLLQQVSADTSWNARKKIDLRYHELSESGYQQRLAEMLQLAPIAEHSEIERAKRVPPSNSPASKRGYMVREFSDSNAHLTVDWHVARYWADGKRHTVRFR